MSGETKILLFKLYLELKDDIYNHQLKYLKDFIEKNKDSVETMQIAENYFKLLKTFMKLEDIVSLAFTADTVNTDSSDWNP